MELIDQLKRVKVIAIIRGDYTLDALRTMAQILDDEGVSALEVTMNTPGALDAIRMIRDEFGERLIVGAGTVMEAREVQQVAEAGGRFIVAPETHDPVIKMALGLGLEPIPGALTPTEIMAAHRAGARLIKLFPASLGGVDYLKTINAPLDQIQLVATGGIEIEGARAYLDAGAVAVGMGSSLIPKRFDATPEEVVTLRDRAKRLMQSLV